MLPFHEQYPDLVSASEADAALLEVLSDLSRTYGAMLPPERDAAIGAALHRHTLALQAYRPRHEEHTTTMRPILLPARSTGAGRRPTRHWAFLCTLPIVVLVLQRRIGFMIIHRHLFGTWTAIQPVKKAARSGQSRHDMGAFMPQSDHMGG
jgi:hypothetical protein